VSRRIGSFSSLAASPWAWAAGVVSVGATVVVIAYFSALDGAFVFDDEVSIVENSSNRRLWSLRDVLAPKAEEGLCLAAAKRVSQHPRRLRPAQHDQS